MPLPTKAFPSRGVRIAGMMCLLAAMTGAVAMAPRSPQPPAAPRPSPPDQPPAPATAPTAAPIDPPETVLILKDGQRFTGFLVAQTPERIVLRIAGIDTPIRADLVSRLEVLPPVEERYRQMRALIDDGDVERLLMLAEWLRVRSRFDDALTEVNQALAAQPDNPDGLRLKLLIESQRELAQRPKAQRPPGEPEAAPAEDAPFPLLSQRDINLIKVYEVDLKNPPRMVVPRQTIAQLIENFKGHPRIPANADEQAALYRASPARILDLMFRLRARDLYEQVEVIDQPRSMRIFRDDVHRTWLINSCGTTRCHGGTEAGRLQLFARRPNTEQTFYTNFIILDRFRLADGSPLVDYEDPANSPLLRMGMPREEGRLSHPIVPTADGLGDLWRPVFRNESDLRYQQAVDWIQALYRPRPNYPITYTPPTPEAITPPAPDELPVER